MLLLPLEDVRPSLILLFVDHLMRRRWAVVIPTALVDQVIYRSTVAAADLLAMADNSIEAYLVHVLLLLYIGDRGKS